MIKHELGLCRKNSCSGSEWIFRERGEIILLLGTDCPKSGMLRAKVWSFTKDRRIFLTFFSLNEKLVDEKFSNLSVDS